VDWLKGWVHPSGREMVRGVAVEWARLNLKSENEFQAAPYLTRSKSSLPELKNFEIKYCEVGIEIKNNFVH
jgi:hypothetical protein